MKKYASYLKEREQMELIESEHGFAVFNVNRELNALYFAEFFVEREYRCTMEAYRLFEEIKAQARSHYLNNIIGSVDTTTLGWQKSERLMKKAGFYFLMKQGNMLFYMLKI